MPLLHKLHPDNRIQHLQCFQNFFQIPFLVSKKKSQDTVFVSMLQTANDASRRESIELIMKCVFACCFRYKTVLKKTYNKGEADELTTSKGSREVV